MTTGQKFGILLWDIDGTLIRTKRTVPSIHVQAIKSLGFYVNEMPVLHKGLTDYQVIKQILDDNKLSPTESQIKGIFSALDDAHRMSFDITDRELCQGVSKKLLSLFRSEWHLGIITGNTASRAISKLSAFNLLDLFDPRFIFTAQFEETREQLAIRAKKKILDLFIGMEELKIIIVGDSPNDVLAAKAAYLPVITVASGGFDYQTLNKVNPNMTIENFAFGLKDFNSILSKI